MSAPLKVPTTYADWSECLDYFEAGIDDDAALSVMGSGTLSWTGGVAPLFARRVSAALDTRIKRIADELSRGIRLGADFNALARAMLDARKKLAQLYQLASLPVLAEELRGSLEQQLTQYAQTAQNSLEDSARHDRSGQLASTIRQCSLLNFKAHAAAIPQPTDVGTSSAAHRPDAGRPSGPVRRRNILV
ncbi:hypothetical protein KZJ38_01035 [Paraburkholderia edwinii]|uniref:Phasin family protein n=1 Tax=Paraburkholderia edwinii TaxID=2861782 RepID=A0ABX8UK96_9BURK|nr:hypothetical protein [Paraburkholderia edwinii]QYD69016.1 hypothetical protein KZJ38_01035 [Paraburkholderia edwinii]